VIQRYGWLAPALIVLVYAQAMFGPMQFDDYATLAVDPGNQRFDAWWHALGLHVRPLAKLSFVLSHQLGTLAGDPVLAHHLGSLLIHLTATLAVGALSREVIERCIPALETDRRDFAVLGTALLFGLHPAATEAVSYLSGRSVALGTLFATLALLAHLRGRHLAAIGAFVAAAAARETMVFAIPLAWLLEWGRADRDSLPFSAARLRSLLPLTIVVAIAMSAAGLWMLANDRYAVLLELSTRIARDRLDLPSLPIALRYFAELLLLLRYPSIDPAVDVDMSPIARWGFSLGVAVALVLAWHVRRIRPEWLLGLGWGLLLLAPLYLVTIRHDPVADRHLYPALAAAALVGAVSIARLRHGRIMLLAATVLALAIVTATRNADYRSEVALWEAAARGAPDKQRVLNNLGAAYIAEHRWKEAEAVLRRATELDPGYDLAAENLLRAIERNAQRER
jgi:protein O-mannosyl-transferase